MILLNRVPQFSFLPIVTANGSQDSSFDLVLNALLGGKPVAMM